MSTVFPTPLSCTIAWKQGKIKGTRVIDDSTNSEEVKVFNLEMNQPHTKTDKVHLCCWLLDKPFDEYAFFKKTLNWPLGAYLSIIEGNAQANYSVQDLSTVVPRPINTNPRLNVNRGFPLTCWKCSWKIMFGLR